MKSHESIRRFYKLKLSWPWAKYVAYPILLFAHVFVSHAVHASYSHSSPYKFSKRMQAWTLMAQNATTPKLSPTALMLQKTSISLTKLLQNTSLLYISSHPFSFKKKLVEHSHNVSGNSARGSTFLLKQNFLLCIFSQVLCSKLQFLYNYTALKWKRRIH